VTLHDEIRCYGGDGDTVTNPEKFLLQHEETGGPVHILKSWHRTWHKYRLDEHDPSRAHYIGPDTRTWE
jgi:hypothetical protein